MEIGKLSPAERIIALFGVLLLIDSFIPWFRICISFLTISRCGSHNAWDKGLSLIAVLLAVLMVAQIAATRFASVKLPNLGSLTWGQVHLIAGVAVLVLVLLQFIVGDSGVHRYFGIYLGILFSLGLAYGALQRSREPEPLATS
ncbi:MAG TPA: hypothetical protein VF995_10085 [Actinomycetota bacterium]